MTSNKWIISTDFIPLSLLYCNYKINTTFWLNRFHHALHSYLGILARVAGSKRMFGVNKYVDDWDLYSSASFIAKYKLKQIYIFTTISLDKFIHYILYQYHQELMYSSTSFDRRWLKEKNMTIKKVSKQKNRSKSSLRFSRIIQDHL